MTGNDVPEAMMDEKQKIVRVAAAIISREGRYLIAKRKAGAHLAGFWEFPGGKCETGESLEECLRREVREELDVTISNPVPFEIVHHSYPDKTVELHFYRCSISGGVAEARECAEIRWVSGEELQEYTFPPADEPVLHALRRL